MVYGAMSGKSAQFNWQQWVFQGIQVRASGQGRMLGQGRAKGKAQGPRTCKPACEPGPRKEGRVPGISAACLAAARLAHLLHPHRPAGQGLQCAALDAGEQEEAAHGAGKPGQAGQRREAPSTVHRVRAGQPPRQASQTACGAAGVASHGRGSMAAERRRFPPGYLLTSLLPAAALSSATWLSGQRVPAGPWLACPACCTHLLPPSLSCPCTTLLPAPLQVRAAQRVRGGPGPRPGSWKEHQDHADGEGCGHAVLKRRYSVQHRVSAQSRRAQPTADTARQWVAIPPWAAHSPALAQPIDLGSNPLSALLLLRKIWFKVVIQCVKAGGPKKWV